MIDAVSKLLTLVEPHKDAKWDLFYSSEHRTDSACKEARDRALIASVVEHPPPLLTR